MQSFKLSRLSYTIIRFFGIRYPVWRLSQTLHRHNTHMAKYSLVFGGEVDGDVASSSQNFIQLVGIDLRYALVQLTNVFNVTGDSKVKKGCFPVL